MEGNLCDKVVPILIDPGSNYSYNIPYLVDKCFLNKDVHEKSRFVQLAMGTKRRVHHWVRYCTFELNGMPTSTHLNVFPLGLKSMILGMNWLFLHRTKLGCYEKVIECIDDDGERRFLQGKNNSTSSENG